MHLKSVPMVILLGVMIVGSVRAEDSFEAGLDLEPLAASGYDDFAGEGFTGLPAAACEGTCQGCCCQCRSPRWSVTAGAIFLTRDSGNDVVLMQDTTDPARRLSSGDFDFDYQAGWEVSAGCYRPCALGLDLRYFGVSEWDASARAVTNSTLLDPLQITTNPPTFAPNVQTIDARQTSELHSFEANLQIPAGRDVTWLAGFRYLQLNESFRSVLDASPQTFTYDVDTDNSLIGGQLGFDAVLLSSEHFSLTSNVSLGLYYNDADQASSLNTGAATVVAADDAGEFAISSEVSLAAQCNLTSALR